ncbi:MAG TPA: helix-turn-helix transcriptional regulator [Erysipelotrichaceae bacterium]|nr:helix-turn-helix transcriptional regulator [Erysipelotrichaceae bacterium]
MAKIDYADGILQLRAKLNLSQEELAKILGVSYISVNRWENDKYAPTKLVKVKLNQLFKEHNIEVKEVNE